VVEQMNDILIGGCALAGALAGFVLDGVAASVPPASEPNTASANDDGSATPVTPVESSESNVAFGDGSDVLDTPPPFDPVPASRGVPGRARSAPRVIERVGVAAVAAVLLAGAGARFGAVPVLAPYCVLFLGLVTVSVVDIRVGLVPRKILYPAGALMVIGLTAASLLNGDVRSLLYALVGGIVAFVVFFGIWWFYPSGMGFGDVRLAGVIGVGLGWLGPLHIYVGFLIAFVIGAIYGIVVMALRGTGRKTRVPFGPALAVGAVAGVLFGSVIVNHWLPGHT
jgi:leader peptidase (prepilin peptidase)/N-methyltransferase